MLTLGLSLLSANYEKLKSVIPPSQAGLVVLRIEGPLCTCDCCCEVTFSLYRPGEDLQARQYLGFRVEVYLVKDIVWCKIFSFTEDYLHTMV